ncbi:unnamed protein product, partial [Rotaria magnacalcarata]
ILSTTTEQKEGETKWSSADEQQVSWIPETETKIESGLESQSVSISPEQKADETNITATEKKQVSLVTEEQEAEKTKIVVIDEQQPVSTISEETETTAITSS